MNSNPVISKEAEHITETKTFYAHIFVAIVCIPLLFVINLMTSAHYLWAVWPLGGWGFALLINW
ncbi:MAG: 2TM domain-containing protein, partial [Algicola sp.]|nr:2TM domain-containing protein [Algicola sp.]